MVDHLSRCFQSHLPEESLDDPPDKSSIGCACSTRADQSLLRIQSNHGKTWLMWHQTDVALVICDDPRKTAFPAEMWARPLKWHEPMREKQPKLITLSEANQSCLRLPNFSHLRDYSDT